MNDVKKNITNWIKEYAKKYNKNLVIGISGGIDSAVTSTLCAETNLKTIVVSMPRFGRFRIVLGLNSESCSVLSQGRFSSKDLQGIGASHF